MSSLALIGGTGFNGFDKGVTPVDESWLATPYGEPSAPVDHLECEGTPFLFLARHGKPHQIPPHKINYRANIYALKEQGVTAVIGINAVGAIPSHLKTPQMVVPHQLIDLTHGRENTYSDGLGMVELKHVDFSYPYDESLRTQLIACAESMNFPVDSQAVYACTQGPRLETAAEIDYIERIGGDLVGMTAMPEAALCREMGIDYANLCLVVNPAAGRGPEKLSLDDIKAAYEKGMIDVRATLLKFVREYAVVS